MLRTGNLAKTLTGNTLLSVTDFHDSVLTVLDRYLQLEEDLVVPYRFGVYDLLVLPPSFPYGGMVRYPHLRHCIT
jgi:hypothetical protein